MRGTRALLALCAVLALLLPARGASAQSMVADLTSHLVAITTGFTGTSVVLFGATGFAGRLVAGYLAGHAPGGVRIGLAGRSAQRLADVRAQLGAAASAWPLLVADSADPVSVAAPSGSAAAAVEPAHPNL